MTNPDAAEHQSGAVLGEERTVSMTSKQFAALAVLTSATLCVGSAALGGVLFSSVARIMQPGRGLIECDDRGRLSIADINFIGSPLDSGEAMIEVQTDQNRDVLMEGAIFLRFCPQPVWDQ